MNGARELRWLVWAGPVFFVVFFIVVFAVEGNTPGEQASAVKIMNYYNSHHDRTLASVFLAPLGAALLVLFFSHVRSVARERAIPVGPGPTVMVAGAVLWASGLLLGSVLNLTLISSSNHGQVTVAQTANVLNNDAWIPFIAGIAVTMVGAGLTVLGSGIVPRWLGWVALVAGVVSLAGPGGFLGFFIGPLWMLVVGVLLARRSPAAAAAA